MEHFGNMADISGRMSNLVENSGLEIEWEAWKSFKKWVKATFARWENLENFIEYCRDDWMHT